MFLKLILFFGALSLGFNSSFPSNDKKSELRQDALQYRVAFDMGSLNLKMQAAWFDPIQNRIVEVAVTDAVTIPVRESIDHDPNGNIPESVVVQLKDNLKAMQVKAEQHGKVSGYTAGGTEAYRVAKNGSDVIDRLSNELGIRISLLAQEEEALLGYHSLKAEGLLPDEENVLIWENGGGSAQFSKKIDGTIQTYLLAIGKVPMKNHLIQKIQGKNSNEISTPNPISQEEALQAIEWVKIQFQDAPEWTKKNEAVLGMSAMFTNVQNGLGKATFTKGDLWQLIEKRIGKTDEELSPKSDPATSYMLSDLLFLYGAMEALEIDQVTFSKTTGPGNTSGLLIDSSMWD